MVFSTPQYNANHRDLNAKGAWELGYTGKGVVVSILDDGIEKNHPDLISNYVSITVILPLASKLGLLHLNSLRWLPFHDPC